MRVLQDNSVKTACLAACVLAALAVGASAGNDVMYGTVTYAATGQRVAGATVKAYDNDNIGREYMGSGLTNSQGAFTIFYSDKDWDWCCGGSTRPDPTFEVYINGVLWLKTGELASNAYSGRTFNLAVQTPKISGTVRWADSTTPVVGAIIRAYDNDPIGRDSMGSTTTSSSGSFLIIWNPEKQWDTCCFDATKPDIKVEVWYNGVLWATSTERSNNNGDLSLSFSLTRILVTGTTYWEETCKRTSGVSVAVKDDDFFSSETMVTGTTSSFGSYSISVPVKDGGSNWDFCCGSETNPDIYSEFSWAGKVKGKTSVRNDVSVSSGGSYTINQGYLFLPRGDATSGALATEKGLGLDTVDWVEVEEFNSCTPRQIRVSFIINFQKEGSTTEAQFTKLKALTKLGLAENWSRTGTRAVLLSNGLRYDVLVQVVERSSGKNVELKWNAGPKCERSNNVGSVAFFSLDPILYYNEGCARAGGNVNWEALADYNFKETAAHEFGHSVLRESPPAGTPTAWFLIIPLTKGQSWSWTHKGTSDVWQDVLPSAPTYPATGDWDIMLYYRGSLPRNAYDRSFAVEDDVRRLVGIAGKKRVRYSTCTCPLKKK